MFEKLGTWIGNHRKGLVIGGLLALAAGIGAVIGVNRAKNKDEEFDVEGVNDTEESTENS